MNLSNLSYAAIFILHRKMDLFELIQPVHSEPAVILVRWAEAVALGLLWMGQLGKRLPCRRARSTGPQGVLRGRRGISGWLAGSE